MVIFQLAMLVFWRVNPLLFFFLPSQGKTWHSKEKGSLTTIAAFHLKFFGQHILSNQPPCRVVDLALNQSQTLVSPIFRSSLVPSVADNFRKCLVGTNLQPCLGVIHPRTLAEQKSWKSNKVTCHTPISHTNKSNPPGPNWEKIPDKKQPVGKRLRLGLCSSSGVLKQP